MVELAWSHGLRKVELILRWLWILLRGCLASHPCAALVSHIRSSSSFVCLIKDLQMEVRNVYRKGYGVADWLANAAHNSSVGPHVLHSTSNVCGKIYFR